MEERTKIPTPEEARTSWKAHQVEQLEDFRQDCILELQYGRLKLWFIDTVLPKTPESAIRTVLEDFQKSGWYANLENCGQDRWLIRFSLTPWPIPKDTHHHNWLCRLFGCSAE